MYMSWKLGTLGLFLAACGTTGGGGGGGGGGWKTITLPSDHSDDEVSGIYYSSSSSGFITTVVGESASAGAVFAASDTSITGTAFDGNVDQSAGGVLGGLNFQGFVTTASGQLVAVTSMGDLVSAPNGSGTFTDVKNGATPLTGQAAGAYFGANVTVFAHDLNGIEKATGAPGPNASYTDVFDPGSVPTVPDPIPADQCQDEIKVNDSFASGLGAVAFSSDGNTIAYTTYSDADAFPEVCVSTDGGQTFHPTEFTGKPETIPAGVIFPKPSAPSTMIVYSGDLTDQNANYVLRSTDGGATFSPVTLPSALANTPTQLYGAFFLPDGQNGWLVGYDGTADAGLALATTDGGQTWTQVDGVAAATSEAKLHAVFALDTTHVWMGGERGTFIATAP
jgi:photosystem II stability/assembly factor-like uncharacterized protein